MQIAQLKLNYDNPLPNIITAAFANDSNYHNVRLQTEAYFTISFKGAYITYFGMLVAEYIQDGANHITIRLLENNMLIPSGSLVSFPTTDIALIALRKSY